MLSSNQLHNEVEHDEVIDLGVELHEGREECVCSPVRMKVVHASGHFQTEGDSTEERLNVHLLM